LPKCKNSRPCLPPCRPSSSPRQHLMAIWREPTPDPSRIRAEPCHGPRLTAGANLRI
jgi:hypothetical protein